MTHAPTDVPSPILAQLGNRVQHALRAFTPDDADNLRKTVRTFPMTDFYDVEKTLTSLGIGEALVTVLSPRGVPTPLAATRLIPPDSLMAAIADNEVAALVLTSPFQAKYGTTVDRLSAHEMIQGRIATARELAVQASVREGVDPTTAEGLNTMTPAQQRREIQRQARELAREQREAERLRKAQEKEARADARARQRSIDSTVRTAGRVVTSRAGQSLIRGIFDTIFGGGRKR